MVYGLRGAPTASPSGITGAANKGSSARQNTSPTVVVQCHGARTRLGPRGGGRLRVCPLTPSRRLHCLLYRRSRPAPLTARIQHGSRRGRQASCSEPSRATRHAAQSETHREAWDPRGDSEATDSSTVGDASPEMRFPRRRAGSRKEVCLPGWKRIGRAKCEAFTVSASSRRGGC